MIEILTLRAMALYALGNLGEAREAISRALRLAGTEGFLRVFLDQGEAMHRLLLEIPAGPRSPQAGEYPLDEIARVLAAFSGEQAAHRQTPAAEAGIQWPENATVFTRRAMAFSRKLDKR